MSLDIKTSPLDLKERQERIQKAAGKGGVVGFFVGCSASIIGIPLAIVTYRRGTGKLPAAQAKRLIQVTSTLGFPGILTGAFGMLVGRGLGTLFALIQR